MAIQNVYYEEKANSVDKQLLKIRRNLKIKCFWEDSFSSVSTASSSPHRIVNYTSSFPRIPAAVDEKGLRERRENTSGRFQAFYNALGHENWNWCCLNDEMAHQRDLDWGPHNWSPRGHLHPRRSREGMTNTLSSTQLLNFCVLFFFFLFLFRSPLNRKGSCSGELFRFEHELGLRVGIWMWQTWRERRGPENREVVARHQSYFCL